jgi:arylsulfatase A
MKFRCLSFLSLCLLLITALPAPAGQTPNIVYILADDLGYGDLACQNSQSKIPTPNMDRLASLGIRFTDAHDPTSVCTPSRYGILTGRYSWRGELKHGVLEGYSRPLIEPGRLTVASLLQQQGYTTACIGKWHLGLDWPLKKMAGENAIPGSELVVDNDDGLPMVKEERIDFTQPIKGGPCTRGFDYFLGIAASLDMPPYVFIENDHVVSQPTERQGKLKSGYVRPGAKDPAFRFEEVLPKLTAKSINFIKRQTKTKPFFLYFALNAPHTPIAPTAQFKGKSKAGDYGDYVVEVDWVVGKILKALEQRKLAKNTLIIVTSDNGPETLAYPRAKQFHHYSMGDWRGVKRDVWEGGHRVPFLARWPGHIRPGSLSHEIICETDLMATLAAIVGAQLPPNAGEDSYNILPALLSEPSARPIREATVHQSISGKFAIRQGDWVFIDAKTGNDSEEPRWFKQERGYQEDNFPGELYNLSSDASEHHNLYGEQPEKVKALKALLEKYKTEGRSAPLAE